MSIRLMCGWRQSHGRWRICVAALALLGCSLGGVARDGDGVRVNSV